MHIGVDLDNTIISYGPLFRSAAVARNWVPPDLPPGKLAVKSRVLSVFGNPAWTELQAEVYGPLLEDAVPYPGAADFFRRCRLAGVETCIISHKSRFPVQGERSDLRVAALRWLETNGWFSPSIGLRPADVEFHDTRASKIEAVAQRGCDCFVDDLPEVFADGNFPPNISAILFDPDNAHPGLPGVRRFAHWHQIEAAVFSALPA